MAVRQTHWDRVQRQYRGLLARCAPKRVTIRVGDADSWRLQWGQGDTMRAGMNLFGLFGQKSIAERELDSAMAYVARAVFPNGQSDVEHDAQAIRSIFGNKLTAEQATRFVTAAKVLIRIAENKSPERIVPSLMRRAGKRVTEAEAEAAYVYLIGCGLSYFGGDGSTAERAVVISAPESAVGIRAEQAYLAKQCGRIDKDWRIALRATSIAPAGRTIETISIVLKDGSRRNVYFDVTASSNGSEGRSLPPLACESAKR